MDDESLNNLRAWSMKLYDDFEPVRQFIAEHPETKDIIVRAIVDTMNQSLAQNFYGPSPHGR
jgi:hypothetical protein